MTAVTLAAYRAAAARHRQRADQILNIATSALANGKMMPTLDAIAAAMGCSRATVQRSFDRLVANKSMVVAKVIVLRDASRKIPSRNAPISIKLAITRFRVVSVRARNTEHV